MYNGTVYDSLPQACAAAGIGSSEIYRRASKLGITLQEAFDMRLAVDVVYKAWTPEEDEILKTQYPKVGRKVLQSLPGRSWSATWGRISRLGIVSANSKESWTDDEDSVLRANYASMDFDELCKMLPRRSDNSIRHHAKRLGLNRSCAQNLTRMNRNIRIASDYADGWAVIVCNTCLQVYLLTEERARNFTHADCLKLAPVPDGWALPRAIIERCTTRLEGDM